MNARSLVWPALLGVLLSIAEAGAQLLSAASSVTLQSRILAENRTVFVAVPESYARGAERYPVVLSHGCGLEFRAHSKLKRRQLRVAPR